MSPELEIKGNEAAIGAAIKWDPATHGECGGRWFHLGKSPKHFDRFKPIKHIAFEHG